MTTTATAAPAQRTFPEATAVAALAPLLAAGPYLPWGAGVMRAPGLVEVCNDIVLRDRRCVVELGGGTSTVLLARLLRERCSAGEAVQIVVEHDARWAQWLRAQLDREGLGDRVSVLEAPLAAHPVALDNLEWYDEQLLHHGLDVALGARQVDLLVVDGPPADTADRVLARYPGPPCLADRLAPGATVVLDDVERAGEQEVLRRWEAELPMSFTRRGDLAGIAVASVPTSGLT